MALVRQKPNLAWLQEADVRGLARKAGCDDERSRPNPKARNLCWEPGL